MLFLSSLLLFHCILADIKNIFDTNKEKVLFQHCPFYDMKGVHKACSSNHSSNRLMFPAKLGVGWDPITAELKMPLIDFTYDIPKHYLATDGQMYAFPDQVTMSVKNANYTTTVTKIYTNINQYLEDLNPIRSNISAGNLAIPLDVIPDFFHFFGAGHNNIVTVIEKISPITMKFVDPISSIKLNPFVKEMISSLPKTYDDKIYGMLIEYLGTSVVISAEIGALAQQTVMIKQCFGGVDLTSQSSLYMMKQFHPEEYSRIDFAAGFSQYSRASIIEMYGGNPKYVDLKEWKNRSKTVDIFPVILFVQTKPLVDFIDDPIIKSNIGKAIDAYLKSAIPKIDRYRREYENSLNVAQTITYVGRANPNNIVLSTQQFSLGTGGNVAIPKSPSTDWHPMSYYEGFGCARTSSSTIRSFVDYSFMSYVTKKEYRSKLSVTSWNGADVAYGCSESSYTFDLGRMSDINLMGPISMSGFCCMNCIPDVRCDSRCHFYGCTCPSF